MIKFIFFPLWNIEKLESALNEMEHQGYRLDYIKYDYWFHFRKANSKKASYFLSYRNYKSSKLIGLDNSLLTEHKAQLIKETTCFYKMFRTLEPKENLKLLYGIRTDLIKEQCLKNFIAVISLTLFWALLFVIELLQPAAKSELIVSFIIGLTLMFFSIYYLYGYFVQKKKITEWEKNNITRTQGTQGDGSSVCE